MEILNWIILKNNIVVEYVQGTHKAVKKYLEELYHNDSNFEYSATGSEGAFVDTIKYKVLDMEEI